MGLIFSSAYHNMNRSVKKAKQASLVGDWKTCYEEAKKASDFLSKSAGLGELDFTYLERAEEIDKLYFKAEEMLEKQK